MSQQHLQSNDEERRRGHRRRTSEPPPDMPRPSLVGSQSRSTRDLLRTQQPQASRLSFDVTRFTESWSNTSETDFLGGASFSSSMSLFSPSLHNEEQPFGPALLPSHTRSSSFGSTGLSAIHDAARITDWDTVLDLCPREPDAAAYQGKGSWTALHHACNRRCPRADVVEALLEASKGSLYVCEHEKGWLPLHLACRFKLPVEGVKLLLKYDTGHWTVSKRDRLGRTPLFYAIRYDAPPGVVELLLQQDPSVVLKEDENEDSPLKLVWDAWADKLQGKRIVHAYVSGGFEPDGTQDSGQDQASLLRERLSRETKLLQKWNKANMLLRAAFGFPIEEKGSQPDGSDGERVWRIVHATAAVKCHLQLFLLACSLYPEQVAELDNNDLRRPGDEGAPHQTALHLAASSNAGGEAGKAVIVRLLSLYREAAAVQDGIDGSLPLHRLVENEHKRNWAQHGAILYHFYPRAVQVVDNNGRLPLHRAAAAMCSPAEATSSDSDEEQDATAQFEEKSVIIQLIRAFPQAAARVDLLGYFPLHLAVQNASSWDDNLERLYTSHRAALQARGGPDNRLALHMAAANKKTEASLIERLLELHPRAASMADRCGRLPLHLACTLGHDWEVVRRLYDAYPPAIQEVREGMYPLHMACLSVEVDCPGLIAELVELHRGSASVFNQESGRYPLHDACASGKTWEDLNALIQADASIVSAPDARNMMPFHVAALKYCRDEEEDPDEIPPWLEEETAHSECEGLDVLYELLRVDPTVL